jgi:hypothetical protein
MECPVDFTHEDDGSCCGLCAKTIIDHPLSGCDAVTCMECPADFIHEDDGSCCGVCTKTVIEP